MSKAYDHVESNFLKEMLDKMGFNKKLSALMLECVTFVIYKISHLRKEFRLIVPSRGIKKGDPISSYLFLICKEGLSALIHDYERRQLLTGIKITRGAPSLSHMFFAADSYIYCKANADMASQINHMLHIYERASDRQINKTKFSVFFSCNTVQKERTMICTLLGFLESSEETIYLELPNIVGRNKKVVFGYLKNCLPERIKGWDKKYLSKGGKELLLKTVSRALPSYAMSIFILPKQLQSEMESLMCKYWW